MKMDFIGGFRRAIFSVCVSIALSIRWYLLDDDFQLFVSNLIEESKFILTLKQC